ncbi:MAG: metalloregulator ArsR/SmtB family transcription factor [Tepidisphaeraceae bacterium]
MARSATTLDPFAALGEPRRRRVMESLADGERPVTDLVTELKLPQPTISKHLAVLREVGLVEVRQEGRQRLYRVNGAAMKPIHEWAGRFERFWQQQLDRIKQVAEAKARARQRQLDAQSRKEGQS